MPLTGKQKKQLRALGQRLEVGLHFGKAGLTEALLRQAEADMGRCELIKVRFPHAVPAERKTACTELAAALSAEAVGMVGHTALLYRANVGLPADQRTPLS